MLWDFKKAITRSSTLALSVVVTIFAFVPENVFSAIHTFLEKFFCSFDTFQEAFSNSIGADTCWEDMDDSELEEWIETLENQYQELSMLEVSIEE